MFSPPRVLLLLVCLLPCLLVSSVGAQEPVDSAAIAATDSLEVPDTLPAPPEEEVDPFDPSPGGAFKTFVGGQWIMPLRRNGLSPSSTRLPSARFVVGSQSSGVVGVYGGAMRLAPDRVTGPGPAGPDLRQELALTAGLFGLKFNVLRGSVRVGPFIEGGLGRLMAQVDSGGYLTGNTYVPDLHELSGMMLGGGGGLGLEVILGPGITLSGLAGYSHYAPLNEDIDALRGAYVGAGLSWSFRNNRWYWRTSGRDDRPPAVRVWSPEPSSSGVVNAGTSVVGLELVASDLSGIDSVQVGVQRLILSDAPEEAEPEDPAEGEATMATGLVSLDQGPNYFDVVVWDGAGNRSVMPIRVLGVPLDETAPEIAVFTPEQDETLDGSFAAVEGVAYDDVDVRQVEVNGLRARLEPASDADRRRAGVPDGYVAYRFVANAPVDEGRNAFRVIATDTMSNEGVLDRFANGPTPENVASAPTIEILAPADWTASDGSRGIGVVRRSSVRVQGMARYPLGIQDIQVDGRPATMEFNNNGTVVNFEGFVSMTDRPRQVLIQANGVDAAIARRTFQLQPRPVPDDGMNALARTGDRQRWAIVIGVSDYLDDRIPDLEYADDDARAFYEFLRSPAAGLGGIPEENITYLVDGDATERNIRTALQTFLRRSTEDDVIMVYIAAHGMPDPERPEDFYLIAHDTDLDNLPVTAIDMQLVQTAVNDAFAYNKIVFTDACHSGGIGANTRVGFNNNRINEIFQRRMSTSTGGLVMFTASETNQLSQEHERWGGGHGVFTHYLLEGLGGAADENGDGIVELGEAMEYTRDRVRRDTENAQVPTISVTQYDRFWPMAVVPTSDSGSPEEH